MGPPPAVSAAAVLSGSPCREVPVMKLWIMHPGGTPPVLGPCHYPEPPLPPELDDGVEAAAAYPDTVTSCQTPPDRLRPLPLAWPGALSPT